MEDGTDKAGPKSNSEKHQKKRGGRIIGNNIKGITVEIGGNTQKLTKALSDVNKDVKGTQSELKEVEKLLKLDPQNTEALAQKQQLLGKAIEETKEKLEVLKTAEAQVEEQFQRGEVSEEQYRALRREIEATELSLQGLEDEAAESNSTLQEVGETFEKVGSENDSALQRVGETFGEVGNKASVIGEKLMPVTKGIVGLGKAGIEAAKELDAGYDTIIKKTGATGETLEELNDVADNLFTNIPIEMEDAGTAVGEINTRFGVTGDTLQDLSEQFIEFANINETDLNDAIGRVDKIMEQYNIDAAETGNVLGLITQKGQETGISVDTLMDSVQKNGATFKEMGLNMVQSTNLLAQFEANGVNADTAVAGLRKSIKAYTDEGKSVDEALTITIDSIKNASSETEALAIAQEVFGTKGAAEMATAIREGRIDVESLSSSMQEYGTVVEDTFNATLNPWDEAKVAANNLKLSAAELGSTVLSSLQPIITKTVDKVKEFTQWFKNLNDGQKETIVKIAAVVAAIGPALLILGKVCTGIQSIIGVVGKIGTAIKAAKGAFAAFNAVMAANPIFLVIAAIVAIIAILVLLYNKCEWFRNAVDTIFGAIKTAFFAVWDAVTEFFTVTLPGAIESVVEFFQNLWDGIVAVFSEIGQWFLERFTEAYTNVTSVFSGIGAWFSQRWQDIKNALATVATWYLTMFTKAYTNVTKVFSGIGAWFGQRWQDIKNALKAIPSWFQSKFKEAWTNIKNVFSGVGSFFSGIWGTIKTNFTNIGQKIGDAIGGTFKAAMNSALSVVENTVNKAVGFINGAIGIINKIPGVSIGYIKEVTLPRLAHGGIVEEGQAIVAEAGPELLTMVNGKTIVTPLTGTARNTAMQAASAKGGYNQTVNIYSPEALSPYEVARQTRNQTKRMVLAIQRG